MSRKVIITLPPDLERHVEDVDGRKLPSVIVEALRKQWTGMGLQSAAGVEIIRTISVEEANKIASTYNLPTYGSIPSERKDG